MSTDTLREKAELILDLVTVSGVKFSRNDRVFDAGKSMQSADLVRSLMKLGLFSVNVTAFPDNMSGHNGAVVDHTAIPAAIIGLGMDYAVEVAPRSPGNENIVMIDDLDAHVARIEAHVALLAGSPGGIVIDEDLVAEVVMASLRSEMAVQAPAATPETAGIS